LFEIKKNHVKEIYHCFVGLNVIAWKKIAIWYKKKITMIEGIHLKENAIWKKIIIRLIGFTWNINSFRKKIVI